MTFWIIVSIICILISILFYLSITQDTPNLAPNSDLEVYKDQLINVERDLSRGIITEDEAERIRAEVSRRILELDKRKQRSLEKETKVTGLIFSIVILLIFIAGGSFLYQKFGAPGYENLSQSQRIKNANELLSKRATQEQLLELRLVEKSLITPEGNYGELVKKLRREQNKYVWFKVASAIMTTDTRPKVAYEECKMGNKIIKISGIAKGSGMIAPNMATMLSFIFTDANIPSVFLKAILRKVATTTFNSITVDGDTSTNDMVAIFATGKAKNSKIYNVLDPKLQDFEKALHRLTLNLSKQIVVDGEGAKKFITIKVITINEIIVIKAGVYLFFLSYNL